MKQAGTVEQKVFSGVL